jgi:hypothetical protein
LAKFFRVRLPLYREPATHILGTKALTLELARTAHKIDRE